MDFLNDKEKMLDFTDLTKKQFLESYSYLTEADYNQTFYKKLQKTLHDLIEKASTLVNNNLKNDGDTSWDSQRIACINSLAEFEHTINGIKPSDIKC